MRKIILILVGVAVCAASVGCKDMGYSAKPVPANYENPDSPAVQYRKEREREAAAKKQRDYEYNLAVEKLKATVTDKDYGQKPINYKGEIQRIVKSHLKDPDSAKFTWEREPYKAFHGLLSSSTPIPSWVVHVLVNAKNSYGGYVGDRMWHFYYDKGKLYSYQGFGVTEQIDLK